jgi:hypothetical protein
MTTITIASLLHPAWALAWAPGEEIADGAQLVDGEWWHPQFGCDSLQYVVDNARQALAPEDRAVIQDGWRALERRQDLRMWPAIDPGKEAAEIAIARELRGPYV